MKTREAVTAGTRARETLLDRIGNTPLVEIRRINPSSSVRIFAKLEGFNPGGSVKDRPALWMIRDGERKGLLHPGKVILDATSGNTGIAYAMIAAVKGYRVTLVMPANASPERKRILRAYGARLIFSSPLEGSDGAIREARRLFGEAPDLYFYPDQYENPANWRAHYETTAEEIYRQTEGEVHCFVAGLGTSGTFVGTSRRLKELDPHIVTISFIPDSPLHGIEGLKHMPTALVPGIYDRSLEDDRLEVSTAAAQEMVLRLAREEGLFVGLSSGAALAAALQVAGKLRRGVVVTVFPDNGEKYLSEKFWQSGEEQKEER